MKMGVTPGLSCIYSIFKFLDIIPNYVLQTTINIKKLLINKLSFILYRSVWKDELFNDVRKDPNQKKLCTFRLF